MTAYVIMIREKMRDPDAFKVYAKAAAGARGDHGLTPLAFYGDSENWEGAAADGVVILSFPDRASAWAWYESPAYAESRQHRFAGADYRVLVVDGLA